ncbi:MAG: response regulator [Candidatus Sericytochromatia bacterium]
MTARKVILLVEDNADNRRLVLRLVEDFEATVIEADNGAEGVRLAQSEVPDLILMDLSLPVMDGWEATRRIKADTLTRAIPVIALTAHAMDGDRDKALAAGCDDYISKPIQVGPFLALLERYLEVRE